MRRIAIALLTLSLLAASCGDDGGEGAEPTTTAPESTTSTLGPNTASFRGVTADTIKVGVAAFDWDRLSALGVNFGVTNNGDIWAAAVEAINDRGGVHGRMLETVVVEFLPVGSTEADEACVRLTEDEEIFIVVGTVLNEQILCFTELHETAALVSGGMNDERLERSKAPYVTVIGTQQQRTDAFIELMEAQGVLQGQSLGVIGSKDVSETGFRAMVDRLRHASYDPVEGLIGDNDGDLAQSARDQDLIYERMREADVTVAISTTGVPLEIANAFESNFEPEQWLLATVMTGRGLTDAGVPHDYLDGALAAINGKTGTTAQPLLEDDPLASACIDDIRARTGQQISYSLETVPNNITTALLSCATAIILEAALTNAGQVLTNESLLSGFEAIGEIDLPSYTEATIGPGDYGAIKGLSTVRFNAATGTWELIEG